jgi:sec-independent protein translocase protein TatA
MPGPTELWVVLIIILILFGGSKIPEIMKGLGKGIKEFKKAKNEISDAGEEVKKEIDKESKKEIKDSSQEKPTT